VGGSRLGGANGGMGEGELWPRVDNGVSVKLKNELKKSSLS
jgi:hypothetical protein